MKESICDNKECKNCSECEEEIQNGRDWYDAFNTVQDWMYQKGLWDESDIHEKDPEQTLINGLKRYLYLK